MHGVTVQPCLGNKEYLRLKSEHMGALAIADEEQDTVCALTNGASGIAGDESEEKGDPRW